MDGQTGLVSFITETTNQYNSLTLFWAYSRLCCSARPMGALLPLSLLTGQKSKLCLQVSNLLQLQDGGQLEVSAEHSAAHWRAADPRPAPLRAANDGSTLFLLLLPPPPPRPCPPKLLILSTSPQHPNRFSVFARCLLYTTPPTLLFSDHPPLQLHFNHFWIPFWTLWYFQTH